MTAPTTPTKHKVSFVQLSEVFIPCSLFSAVALDSMWDVGKACSGKGKPLILFQYYGRLLLFCILHACFKHGLCLIHFGVEGCLAEWVPCQSHVQETEKSRFPSNIIQDSFTYFTSASCMHASSRNLVWYASGLKIMWQSASCLACSQEKGKPCL